MALRHASSGTGSGGDVAGRNEGGPGYTSDREQQVSNDMMATNTANKRLTDDYATPIGSMSKDNVCTIASFPTDRPRLTLFIRQLWTRS